ncbi:hypothetical protein NL676_023346 [Syzygium grande]|nr:hypothetical protein NL676_023346 [Syzygium grande]
MFTAGEQVNFPANGRGALLSKKKSGFKVTVPKNKKAVLPVFFVTFGDNPNPPPPYAQPRSPPLSSLVQHFLTVSDSPGSVQVVAGEEARCDRLSFGALAPSAHETLDSLTSLFQVFKDVRMADAETFAFQRRSTSSRA